jgi:hypothetical protein
MADDQTAVINPTEPYRMPDQPAGQNPYDDWRRGTQNPMAPGSPLAKTLEAGPPGVPQPPPHQRLNIPPMPQMPDQKQLGPPPDAKQFQQNSIEFASAMAVLGAVAGRFTRQPGGAALGAFAAAVNGWQTGNLQAYEEANKKWEEQTKQTIANNKMEMDKYKQILQNRQINIDEQMSQIQLVATQFHNDMMYQAAASKNYTMATSIYEKTVAQAEKAKESAAKIQEVHEQGIEKAKGSANYYMNHPAEFLALPPEQQASVKQFAEMKKISGSAGAKQAAIEKSAPEIADAIISGQQPPVLTGLYGASPAVRAALAEKGFDLAKAQLEYKAAEKQIQSLNGPQMTRYSGLANSVVNTIDEVKSLADQMKNSGVPFLNKAKLDAYIQTQGNTPNGQLAAKYVGAVNTLKEEFANLANGGYAPTEPAWKLANEQINGNFGVKELHSSLDEVQRLINFRLHAIPNLQSLGPGSENRYTGATGAKPQTGGASGGWGKAEVVQ